ncbi:MAG: NAD(P)/FAD-dependent oxidoreductase [Rhodospirillales bacterium]|nr:NAD(P)/FAD-dependent oxidoreductase [Rhodospirillales bacterium]
MEPDPALPRLVVIGAGFGGLAAAQGLARQPVALTVIDRRNHHLFQPLLYQVATAGLSPADIATPIRSLFRHRRQVRVLMAEVTGIDVAGRVVRTSAGSVPYDTLVIATGAQDAYFGHSAWERFAPGLKTVEDAVAIRRRILLAFEHAEAEPDPERQRRLLTFVIVGGGPTGVELAGAIAELAKVALALDFRRIDPRSARVVLVEAGPRVLATFPDPLSEAAARGLHELGVEVRTGAAVSDCDADGVALGATRIEAATVLWAAGVTASPAARWLGVPADRAGRVVVGPELTVPEHPEVFVIGDTAHVAGPQGRPLPGVAPVAKQQGEYVARAIAARRAGRAPAAFRYRDLGNLATIGRGRAVADFGWIRLSGRFAWLLWGLVHVAFLIGFRNRIAVLLDWLWAYVTFRRGARLITAPHGPPEEAPDPPVAVQAEERRAG